MHLLALFAVIGGADARTVNAQVQVEDTAAPALAESIPRPSEAPPPQTF